MANVGMPERDYHQGTRVNDYGSPAGTSAIEAEDEAMGSRVDEKEVMARRKLGLS